MSAVSEEVTGVCTGLVNSPVTLSGSDEGTVAHPGDSGAPHATFDEADKLV